MVPSMAAGCTLLARMPEAVGIGGRMQFEGQGRWRESPFRDLSIIDSSGRRRNLIYGKALGTLV